MWATLKFGAAQVRTGHLILALLKTPELRNVLTGMSREFEKVKAEQLADNFAQITANSPKSARCEGSAARWQAAEPGEASGAIAPAQMGKQEALKKFTVDLTEQARLDKIDPVVGRDDEIRQIIDILMRRRQNNPC